MFHILVVGKSRVEIVSLRPCQKLRNEALERRECGRGDLAGPGFNNVVNATDAADVVSYAKGQRERPWRHDNVRM